MPLERGGSASQPCETQEGATHCEEWAKPGQGRAACGQYTHKCRWEKAGRAANAAVAVVAAARLQAGAGAQRLCSESNGRLGCVTLVIARMAEGAALLVWGTRRVLIGLAAQIALVRECGVV